MTIEYHVVRGNTDIGSYLDWDEAEVIAYSEEQRLASEGYDDPDLRIIVLQDGVLIRSERI